MSLENTYLEIKKKFENILDLESFNVVNSVDQHRTFWKPDKVRILLLAESHVYTSSAEHDDAMTYSRFPKLQKCPTNYVRLVYCLGYGEDSLIQVKGNSGTPQFWKIFASCVNQNFRSQQEKILKTKTPNFYQRMNNKISLLEKLKEKGIWLVDASIVALYKDSIKPSEDIMEEIIQICWKQHISKIIQETSPQKIIVIGKGVSKFLDAELQKTRMPYYVQPQPNSRLTREELKKSFETYYELCDNET